MTPSPAPIVTTSAVSRCGHMCPGGLNPLQMKIMAVTHELQKVGLVWESLTYVEERR